jgi:hypothetical protein
MQYHGAGNVLFSCHGRCEWADTSWSSSLLGSCMTSWLPEREYSGDILPASAPRGPGLRRLVFFARQQHACTLGHARMDYVDHAHPAAPPEPHALHLILALACAALGSDPCRLCGARDPPWHADDPEAHALTERQKPTAATPPTPRRFARQAACSTVRKRRTHRPERSAPATPSLPLAHRSHVKPSSTSKAQCRVCIAALSKSTPISSGRWAPNERAQTVPRRPTSAHARPGVRWHRRRAELAWRNLVNVSSFGLVWQPCDETCTVTGSRSRVTPTLLSQLTKVGVWLLRVTVHCPHCRLATSTTRDSE